MHQIASGASGCILIQNPLIIPYREKAQTQTLDYLIMETNVRNQTLAYSVLSNALVHDIIPTHSSLIMTHAHLSASVHMYCTVRTVQYNNSLLPQTPKSLARDEVRLVPLFLTSIVGSLRWDGSRPKNLASSTRLT